MAKPPKRTAPEQDDDRTAEPGRQRLLLIPRTGLGRANGPRFCLRLQIRCRAEAQIKAAVAVAVAVHSSLVNPNRQTRSTNGSFVFSRQFSLSSHCGCTCSSSPKCRELCNLLPQPW